MPSIEYRVSEDFFIQSVCCQFALLIVSFALKKFFIFMGSYLLMVDLPAWATGVPFRKFPFVQMSWRLFSTFSSIWFSVSEFIKRSFIYLDLSFVQGDKYESFYTLLHTNRQSDQLYLMKMVFFFSVHFWLPCQRLSVHSYVGLCLSLWFYSIDHLSVSVPIPFSLYHYCFVIQLEVKGRDIPRRSFTVEDYFGFPGFFFSIWSRELLFPCL